MNNQAHRILGVYVGPHGVSVTLLIDGIPSIAIQLERVLGIKHAWVIGNKHNLTFAKERVGFDVQKKLLSFYQYFPKAIDYVLRGANIKLKDIDLVALEKRNIMNNPFDSFYIDADNELDDFFSTHQKIYVEHHQGHQAQAYFTSPYRESAILTIDGRSWGPVERVGDVVSLTVSLGTGHEIDTLFESSYSIPSQYYDLSLHLFNNRYCDGKTMGLAAYGTNNAFAINLNNSETKKAIQNNLCPACLQKGKHTLTLVDRIWCKKHADENETFTREWIQTSPKQLQGYKKDSVTTEFLEFSVMEPKDVFKFGGISPLQHNASPTLAQKQVAYLCQKYFKDSVVNLLKDIANVTKMKNVCIGGGAGLNSVANSKILMQTPFQTLHIFPASGDEGLSFGFSLWAYHMILNQPRNWSIKNDFFGVNYGKKEILTALGYQTEKICYQEFPNQITQKAAELLAQGYIIGWFQGRSEFGPRALGHRSILAHPAIIGMKDKINIRVKHRETWRPFAPSILAELSNEYFDMLQGKLTHLSAFMLCVADVKRQNSKNIDSVLHIDGTARLQTVTEKQNPIYYQLIKHFYEITGIPILLNTSFNVNNQPIVENPNQAIASFIETDLDYLVIGDYIVSKRKNETQ